MTKSERSPGSAPQLGRVTRVFRNIVPAILWVTLSNGMSLGTTPGHEVWTLEDGWTLAGRLEVGDRLIDLDRRPVTVLDLQLEQQPTAVYNLEVDGTFTYFVEDVWVHNNSCKFNSFSIRDWSGYPQGVPRPSGPLTVLSGSQYDAARSLANRAQEQFRKANNLAGDKSVQVHHIVPVKFGGVPTSLSNLIVVSADTHKELNRFWAGGER